MVHGRWRVAGEDVAALALQRLLGTRPVVGACHDPSRGDGDAIEAREAPWWAKNRARVEAARDQTKSPAANAVLELVPLGLRLNGYPYVSGGYLAAAPVRVRAGVAGVEGACYRGALRCRNDA